MGVKANDFDYIYLKCTLCNEQVKIAKNKGNYWSTYLEWANWLEDFLLNHGECKRLKTEPTIKLIFDN